MTQAELKFARSLSSQKYRKEYNAYIIEGNKIVKEWLNEKIQLKMLMASAEWIKINKKLINYLPSDSVKTCEQFELDKISNLSSSTDVIAIIEKPKYKPHNYSKSGWTLVLDRIQDPGNMGTIIRIADWFGIDEIIWTPGTVEIFNPKVIQSTMGSILRINFNEESLENILLNAQKPVFATVLGGESIYNLDKTSINTGYIIMGNESKGIDDQTLSKIQNKITIPKIGKAESLNVGVACGIICSHLIR